MNTINGLVLSEISQLDKYLCDHSYLVGYTPTNADASLIEHLKENDKILRDISKYVNINRWYKHMSTYTASENESFENTELSSLQLPGVSFGAVKKTNPVKSQSVPVKAGKDKKSCAEMKDKQKNSIAPVKELTPPPSFLQDRLDLFSKLYKEQENFIASQTPEPIKVTLPDGTVKPGESYRSTPYSVAASISQGLAESTVVAQVDGDVYDLDRPLTKDCTLKLLKFDDPEAKKVFWHSTAHVLGEAMERIYGCNLCYGPPIEEGFYYDMHYEGEGVSQEHFPTIENLMKKITKEKQTFERLEITKENLLEMFKYNPFKVRIINEKISTPSTTVYRCGPLIDLCRGPHVRHTGKIKALAVTKASSAYWQGNADAESLQRIYGVSFPDTKMLSEWKRLQEEAAKRDHRKIGTAQKLFFFNEQSPGSAFMLPHGTYIYNTLSNYMREEYRKRGFTEVISPNIYNSKLWKQSGHWQHYAENMFSFDVEKEKFALKPMNCPGHCVMFAHTSRSWRELPLRLADFGVLHRNEASGALTGLTRVRRFQQDDAHIFCAPSQIREEILGCLDFMKSVYDTFVFDFELCLSTRPDKYMGEKSQWDEAEAQLKETMDAFGKPWSLNEGDGAFYGPKIDITVTDALKRRHQCATIQLDFQLPNQFELSYVSETGEKKRPVMIHRAVLGSVERMMAILIEHTAGKWPFWLSPRQCLVVPVAGPFDDYAKSVSRQLHLEGFQAEVDLSPGDTMNKKIRNGQLEQFNFILVVGEKEQANNTVNVRTRDNLVHGEVAVEDLIKRLQKLSKDRVQEWQKKEHFKEEEK